MEKLNNLNDKTMTKAIINLLGIITLIPLILFYTSFSWGYVATVFETWFVIPVFPDFKPITWVQYAGLMFFAHTIIRPSITFMKDEFKDKKSMYSYSILSPWIALFVAWIFKTIFL